jgi:hypothetical protein
MEYDGLLVATLGLVILIILGAILPSTDKED